MNRTKEQWAAMSTVGVTTACFAKQDIAELWAKVEELEAEVQEQCRLTGMGAERELKLIAECDALRQQLIAWQPTKPVLDQHHEGMYRMRTENTALRAKVEELEELV
jgi:BMFP domain-containing protein YqiC